MGGLGSGRSPWGGPSTPRSCHHSPAPEPKRKEQGEPRTRNLDPQGSGCRGSRTFQGSLHQAFQFPDRGLLPACVSCSLQPRQARSNVSQVSELRASSSSHLAPSLLSKPYHPSRLGPHSPSFGSSQTTCHRRPSLPKLLPMPRLQLASSRERSISAPNWETDLPTGHPQAKDLPLHPHPLAYLFCLPEPVLHPGPNMP